MALSPEAQRYYDDPQIQKIITEAQNDAQNVMSVLQMPWGNSVQVRREGKYPLVSKEGKFDATLLRVVPVGGDAHKQRGGELRILANRSLDVGKKIPVIFDAIPLFLKSLADSNVNLDLAWTRERIAKYNHSAMLVQRRASDIHDGEYRTMIDGKQDIIEETWYAKVLTVMKYFKGMNARTASEVLVYIGEQRYLVDYAMAPLAALTYTYGQIADIFNRAEIEVFTGDDYLLPFGTEQKEYDAHQIAQKYKDKIKQLIGKTTSEQFQQVTVPSGTYDISTVATYPIMQDGVEYEVRLISVSDDPGKPTQMFRVISNQGMNDAYVRVDWACINGVHSGDTHCDCYQQKMNEKLRAQQGLPVVFIDVLDGEGRSHGEGKKGGTLAIQRMIEELYSVELGNGIPSQLFYHQTGEKVDAREFGPAQAVVRYLGIERIAHLVTDNQGKIDAFSQVAKISSQDTAKVDESQMSPEALATYKDKLAGQVTGAVYNYRN